MMNSNIQLNILYDALTKLKLVELVMKDQEMDLSDVEKVKTALEEQIKRA